MRIIHTADWHLGQTFYGFDRGKEHAFFLDWLCGIIKEHAADLLLIAGDVFDSPNPSAEAQRVFYHFLTRVTGENPDLQVIVTAGNHDSAARLEAPNPLLKAFGVCVSGIVHYNKAGEIDYDRMIVPLRNGGCCLAVPYLRHNDHPAAESYSEGVAKLYSELYDRAVSRGYKPIIAMGHLQASGAEVSVGDASEHIIIGGMEGLDAGFANSGIVYTALGHLHKAQRVAHRENVRYSGAPLPMSFAERRNRQSVTEVILDGNNCTIEKLLFDTPVKLLSIPATPQPLENVIEELQALPAGDADEFAPFLEVKVKVTAVQIDMRRQIEEAIEGKRVRLARIEAVGSTAEVAEGVPVTYDDFKNIEPEELIKEIYNNCSDEELDDTLVGMLKDVIKEVRK